MPLSILNEPVVLFPFRNAPGVDPFHLAGFIPGHFYNTILFFPGSEPFIPFFLTISPAMLIWDQTPLNCSKPSGYRKIDS